MKTFYRIDANTSPANPNGQFPAYSMAASWQSPALNIDNLEGYSVVASWTGTATGTLRLQMSNNAFIYENTNGNEDPAAVWTTIPGSDYAVSAAGSYAYNVADAYYRAYRVVFIASVGAAGTATLWHFAKGIQ